MMNEASNMKYTVIMRPDVDASDALLAAVRAALEKVEGVSVNDINAPVMLGMNRRDVVLTAFITYSVTVAANLSSAVIEARFQDALKGQLDTQSVVVEEVLVDEHPPIDADY